MHYGGLAVLENSAVKNNERSKPPKPTEDQLRWLDLKHMWTPRWGPRAGSLLGKHSCNIEHRGRRRPLMFAPVCCGLGCFARHPTIMTSLRTPSRRPSKTRRRRLRIHQWRIFIRVHALARPRREAFALKTGSTWEVTKHQMRRRRLKIQRLSEEEDAVKPQERVMTEQPWLSREKRPALRLIRTINGKSQRCSF